MSNNRWRDVSHCTMRNPNQNWYIGKTHFHAIHVRTELLLCHRDTIPLLWIIQSTSSLIGSLSGLLCVRFWAAINPRMSHYWTDMIMYVNLVLLFLFCCYDYSLVSSYINRNLSHITNNTSRRHIVTEPNIQVNKVRHNQKLNAKFLHKKLFLMNLIRWNVIIFKTTLSEDDQSLRVSISLSICYFGFSWNFPDKISFTYS